MPASVRAVLEPRLGIDLGQVPVHRGDDSADAAAVLRAKAFTHDRAVHLPARHGALDTGQARALLAHELVHVAQQTRYGDRLPHEHSPAGRRLEEEAQRVERAVATGTPLPVARAVTRPAPAGPAAHTPAQRAAEGPGDAAAAAVAAGVATADGSGSVVFAPPAPPLAAAAQRAADDGHGHAVGMTAADDASAAPSPAPRGVDVDALARQLYGRIRTELRHELLVDRERSGFAVDR